MPNLLVPPVPTLAVLPVVDGAGNLQAELTVTVPVGSDPGGALPVAPRDRDHRPTADADRRRGSRRTAAGRGPGSAGVPRRRHRFRRWPGRRASLTPWVRYNWRVEVRGAPAPGGGPAAEWSSPSPGSRPPPLPPDPPAAVTDLTVTRDAAGVHVRFRHPEPLTGGGSAGYTVDVYRQLPGGTLRLLTSPARAAPPPTGRGSNVAGFFDVVDAAADAVAGTLYRVVVTDPIGRASQPSAPVEAP